MSMLAEWIATSEPKLLLMGRERRVRISRLLAIDLTGVEFAQYLRYPTADG
jgi:hypothetical protein